MVGAAKDLVQEHNEETAGGAMHDSPGGSCFGDGTALLRRLLLVSTRVEPLRDCEQ